MKLSDEIRKHMAESEENRLALWDRIAVLYKRLEAVEEITREIEAYQDTPGPYAMVNADELRGWVVRLRGER